MSELRQPTIEMTNPDTLYKVAFSFDDPRILEKQQEHGSSLRYIFEQEQKETQNWSLAYWSYSTLGEIPVSSFICRTHPFKAPIPIDTIKRRATNHVFSWLEEHSLTNTDVRGQFISDSHNTERRNEILDSITFDAHSLYIDTMRARSVKRRHLTLV